MAAKTNSGEGKTLVACYPILYRAHQYEEGEELPVSDMAMVEAWLEAGTATWKDQEEEPVSKPKAKPATAEPGLPGKAVSSEAEDGVDLVGKVPKTTSRKRK